MTWIAILDWSQRKGVSWQRIALAKPMLNAFIASFNGHPRHEPLNEVLFSSGQDAREKIEVQRHYYNHQHQPSGLGSLPLAEFAEKKELAMHAAYPQKPNCEFSTKPEESCGSVRPRHPRIKRKIVGPKSWPVLIASHLTTDRVQIVAFVIVPSSGSSVMMLRHKQA